MSRTRQLRPSFFTSASLARCARDARLLFAGLWVEADDYGRLLDAPKKIAGAVFPHDDDVTSAQVTVWLDELEAVGAVRRYRAGAANLLVIPAFVQHQKVPHPTPSTLPCPPEPRAKRSRKHREPPANGSRESHDDLATDSRGFPASVFDLVSGSTPPTPPDPANGTRPAARSATPRGRSRLAAKPDETRPDYAEPQRRQSNPCPACAGLRLVETRDTDGVIRMAPCPACHATGTAPQEAAR